MNTSRLPTWSSDALSAHLEVESGHVLPLLGGLTDKAEASHDTSIRSPGTRRDLEYYRADGERAFVEPHAARYATPNQPRI